MKKYIYMAIFLVTGVVYSQQSVVRTVSIDKLFDEDFDALSGDYFKDISNNYNQYVGTWRYTGNGIVFTVKLTKMPQLISVYPNGEYNFYDEMVLTYKLEKNNVVLFDNLNSVATSQTLYDNTYGMLWFNESFDYINGIFKDIPNNVKVTRCEIRREFEYLNQTPKIFFKLYPNHALTQNPASFYQGLPSLFSVPNEIILEKIN